MDDFKTMFDAFQLKLQEHYSRVYDSKEVDINKMDFFLLEKYSRESLRCLSIRKIDSKSKGLVHTINLNKRINRSF